MRRLFVAFFFVALPGAAAIAVAQNAPPPPRAAASASGLDLTSIDRSADPCGDFYQFACGQWITSHPIPADRARWGRFDDLQEQNSAILRRVLDAAAGSTNPATRQVGDYYASCLDEAAVNKRGAAPIASLLKRIAALRSTAELPALVGDVHTIGVNAFFGFGAEADFKDAGTVIAILGQGGLGLPDRDYYLRNDAKSAEIRTQYADHVARMMTLAGSTKAAAAGQAQAVMRVESALAKGALDNVSRRDPTKLYHKLTPDELQALTPGFKWPTYFARAGAPPIRVVNVTEPEFMKTAGQVIATSPLADLKAYLQWHVVHADAAVLAAPFVDENFRFYSTTLQGITEQRPRWKRCVDYTDGDLGEALGQAFVNEAFGATAKADALEMVRTIEGALAADIQGLAWMTDATRTEALAKLHAVSDKIGYPDKWRDYSALEVIRGDAVGNSERANAFEFHRQMTRIDKPIDKTEWSMTPPTVNAYYNPLQNNINFPAGILQPPFYNPAADAAVNYGGAGSVVGHEITHGFDDQGRQFDGAGNLHDWWTPEDGKAFDARAACLVNEYEKFSPVEGITLNGKLTLGENTADNGGLRIALMAYLGTQATSAARSLDGFTGEQRFFLGFGQIWCESRRPEFERLRAQTDAHSPARFRVNGTVSNMPEFQKAFGCKADAPMVRAEACRVW